MGILPLLHYYFCFYETSFLGSQSLGIQLQSRSSLLVSQGQGESRNSQGDLEQVNYPLGSVFICKMRGRTTSLKTTSVPLMPLPAWEGHQPTRLEWNGLRSCSERRWGPNLRITPPKDVGLPIHLKIQFCQVIKYPGALSKEPTLHNTKHLSPLLPQWKSNFTCTIQNHK